MTTIIAQNREGINTISRLDDLQKENWVRVYSNKKIDENSIKAMLLIDYYKNETEIPQPNEINSQLQNCTNSLKETKAIKYYNPFNKAFWKHSIGAKAILYGSSGMISISNWKAGLVAGLFLTLPIESLRREKRKNLKNEKVFLENLRNIGIEHYLIQQ